MRGGGGGEERCLREFLLVVMVEGGEWEWRSGMEEKEKNPMTSGRLVGIDSFVSLSVMDDYDRLVNVRT